MLQAEPIFDIKPEHGEGPIWCPIAQKFYCVDLLQGKYFKIDWKTGEAEAFDVGQALGVMALRENGGVVVAVRDGFGFFDEKTNVLQLIDNPPEMDVVETRMNDGAVDPAGRFFAGTMQYSGATDIGKLYRLNTDHSWDCLEENIYIANGQGWSPDERTYYLIDTMRNVLYAYDYDLETGNISNRRPHIQWPKDEYPDGMAMDSEGGFWVAMWEGSKVSHFDAAGKWVKDIAIPVLHTTSCCFGGPDLKTLLVTTSNLNLNEKEKAENPLAGRCFAIETDMVGAIEPRYKG
ncbi:MAG: gluconolactonase [Saprospiraceae bacterium]|nr:MAG: gluconolactonase [Saprospiraceae bacterium]